MKDLLKIIAVTIVILFFSCEKEQSRNVITKSLTDFDTLSLNSSYNVIITQANENSIAIDAAPEILKNISAEQHYRNIVLKNNYKNNWLHPKNNKINVYVTARTLKRITATETCNIKTSNTWTGDFLSLEVGGKLNEVSLDINSRVFSYWNNFPCGGKIIISGKVVEMRLINGGLMEIDASKCNTSIAYVENSSKADCKVNCSNNFGCEMSGEGNIILSGNPPTINNKKESSTGKLIIE